jgi:cytochrome c peroxidase
MTRPRSSTRLALGLLALLGCHDPSANEATYAWRLPPGVAPPPVPADNPQTADKVELGRWLFYDLRLSSHEDRACGTCHEQAKGFTDGFHRAVGTEKQVHGHNTPSVVNSGYRTQLGWASPAPRQLEAQLLVPLLATEPIVEMGMGERVPELLALLAADPIYAELFPAAFPDDDDPFTLARIAAAIAAFERTLISRDAPLDRYLRGDATAIDAAAERGWQLFQDVGCIRCHGGDDFASPTDAAGRVLAEAGYHNVGLYDLDGQGSYPATAQGLIATTGVASDMGRFRTPTLRNLSYTYPYMHDGSVISLAAAIELFDAGGRNVTSGPFVGDGRNNPHKDPAIHPLGLDAAQKADLLALLLALDDVALIEDPSLASPFVE